MGSPYNPLDKLNLGPSVAEALLLRENLTARADRGSCRHRRCAIYYSGGFEAYAPVAEKKRGAGSSSRSMSTRPFTMARERADSRSTRLRAGRSAIRLRHHAGSIDEATIEQFKPIWNLVIYGVGNKDPGKRRATQFRSPWDVLHPGRQFPEKLADGGTTAEMPITRLRAYFAGQFVPLVPADEAGDIGTTEDEEE